MNSGEQNSLCTDVFFKDNFGIDDYLSKCTQKSELLTLRKDLKNYGLELYTTMVDILKMETEDIINLAESLTNLNSKIDELSTPVSQLCEEIRTLYVTINNAKRCFEKHLNVIQSIRTQTDHLNLKMGINSSSVYINNIIASWEEEDITVLERAVNEYSFQYLYLSELGLEAEVVDSDVINTATRLLQLIHTVFFKAIKSDDEETILRSLRMYVNLGRQTEAENCIKEKVVRPVLNKIFTQKNLDDHVQDVNILYQQALTFLNGNMKVLLSVLDRNPDMKGFNFVVNSFWMEVDKQLRENLPNITAPGNPELFQKRFKDTWHFLEEITDSAKEPSLFKKNPTFQAHMKRFNLPVYFEIRFQQIAAKFEAEMLLDPVEFTTADLIQQTTKNSFKLKISAVLWTSIQQCFHNEVFLVPLCDQILKLMMLLISRYLKWFENYLIKWMTLAADSTVYKLEQFIIYALVDISILKSFIGFSPMDLHEFDKTVFKIIPNTIRPLFVQILHINGQSLDAMYSKLQVQLVDFKVQQSAMYLQQVTSIPRLYRRTNRNIPKEPSNYVIEAVSPVTKLYNSYNTIMNDKIVVVMDLAIARLSDQYVGLVQEVLRSVCKTEESLRRLKNRNLANTDDLLGQANVDATSDEAKIREQIKLDVGHFVKELRPFAINVSRNSMKLLIDESGYVDFQ